MELETKPHVKWYSNVGMKQKEMLAWETDTGMIEALKQCYR